MARSNSILREVDINSKQRSRRRFVRRNYDPVGKENVDPGFSIFEDDQCTKSSSKSAAETSTLTPTKPSKECIEISSYTRTPDNRVGSPTARRKRFDRLGANEEKFVQCKDSLEHEVDCSPLYGLEFV